MSSNGVIAHEQPNILFILADDLGYNDVSWHNPDIISPHLEALANNGTKLENAYVQPICSPTRSALMTGYYPMHLGRQSDVIRLQMPRGLFTNYTLMPQHLKNLGYSTHIVGKWHLGFCSENYFPMNRGFDSHYGYLTGSQDYFHHDVRPLIGNRKPGYDFRDNFEIARSANGEYSANLFGKRVIELIENHDHKKPFFIYLAFQSVHSPLQVPQKYIDMYPHIKNKARKTFSGMVTAMDEAVGNITKTLEKSGILDNTLIVFSGDNGGQVVSGGNNYPLRGNKDTIWEGGTRASSFVYGKFLPKDKRGSVNKDLIHVTDWLPTFYAAGGGKVKDLGPIDGVNQWPLLTGKNGHDKRTEMIYNIDPGVHVDTEYGTSWPEYEPGGAIRMGDMKLIKGDAGYPDGWIPPELSTDIDEEQIELVKKIFKNHHPINPNKIRLFNITADPTEKNEISHQHPKLVAKMLKRLNWYRESMIPPDVANSSIAGNPNNFGGIWTDGWCASRPRRSFINTNDLEDALSQF